MKKIIANCANQEIKVALIEDQRLVELFLERPNDRRLVGNIYKGKVANVLPGMQAAFIDLGIGKNAFLYIDDLLPPRLLDPESREKKVKGNIQEYLRMGEELLVQVCKEPLGNKGPRVTTHLTLPGRFLVYLPTGNYVAISRRIENEEERERLKSITEQYRNKEDGFIVRTAAEGASEKELAQDVLFLRRVWQNTLEASKQVESPGLIYRDLDLLSRVIRDLMDDDVEELVVNSKEAYHKLASLLIDDPNLQTRIRLHEANGDIFAYYGVLQEMEKALKRKVWLKSGGYVVFDQTEALIAVDVNTGKFTGKHSLEETVFRTNMEAAREIPRQLRLRGIGGIIIIDFIDMDKPEYKAAVLDALQEEVHKDRTKSQILGITQLGLVEMTRKKVRQSLEDMLMSPCPTCEGRGKISIGEDPNSH
ncbi:Rne/Rng family ribonuclease [Microaerobacter geothermalis]|uniref:Rne/Rng family ribonuclease n=1 Tax=Microaerobacter geothermalis TaxID=674972 RepID=UPI001F1F588E|nr:Rne/Rng family ribonuclease [Microaerobacter geothermalis]MCF6092715.1 Rne/Rng family ribonuclease [Microaerobacter geothermalis]